MLSTELKTAEELTRKHKPPSWLLAAARMKFSWAIGKELTEEEFLTALDKTRNHQAK